MRVFESVTYSNGKKKHITSCMQKQSCLAKEATHGRLLSSELPSLDFASFNSVLLTIIGVCANGGVALIVLILTLILAWNYIKLLFEAAERYVLLGVLVYTAPVAFAMGASQSTANIFKSWCRMFGGQIFLLLMNAWCLRLFLTMVGTFISNPLSM